MRGTYPIPTSAARPCTLIWSLASGLATQLSIQVHAKCSISSFLGSFGKFANENVSSNHFILKRWPLIFPVGAKTYSTIRRSTKTIQDFHRLRFSKSLSKQDSMLIGGYLMPDKSLKEVYLMYLPLLGRLDSSGRVSTYTTTQKYDTLRKYRLLDSLKEDQGRHQLTGSVSTNIISKKYTWRWIDVTGGTSGYLVSSTT
ncbi:uncharacterized protein G2W53_041934 [Senna tora]|uniref:Uncharacterized protein n=1 Tax=Senna tora TaxID=362788 RepID=A0A834SFH8_9FABA|nr:uncharacterized protein G2W53_041934 [Senna tora]